MSLETGKEHHEEFQREEWLEWSENIENYLLRLTI